MANHVKKIGSLESRDMPIDHTGQFLAEVRRYAVAQGVPSHAKLRVSVKIADTGEEVARLLAYPASGSVAAERSAAPPLSAKQKKIVVALLSGAMKGDVLATKYELTNRSSLHSGRGLKQLMEWGLILNDETEGYTLTEFGEDVANEVSEE